MTDYDEEIQAMEAIRAALQPLGAPSRGRVLAWARSRFDIGADLQQKTYDFILQLLAAIGEHAEKNAAPDEASKKLYEALEGTRYALKIEAEPVGGSGV